MLDPVSKSVTITLDIGNGVTLEKLAKTEGNTIYNHRPDVNNLKVEFELPTSMSLMDFYQEIHEQALRKWNIDLKACKSENGGDGVLAVLSCTIDVPGEEKRATTTRMNLPNEETWKAAKYLMKSASGKIVVSYLFAVKRANWVERQGLYWLISHGVAPPR